MRGGRLPHHPGACWGLPGLRNEGAVFALACTCVPAQVCACLRLTGQQGEAALGPVGRQKGVGERQVAGEQGVSSHL